MATLPPNPWVRASIVSTVAGAGVALALWRIDRFLLAHGVSPGGTYMDEILVGVLVAGLILALDLHHQARQRRIREAAKLMCQLNHYIRNSLQVILYSSSIEPHPVARKSFSNAVRRIEWVLDEVVQQSELFSGARSYLRKGGNEIYLAALLNMPREETDHLAEQSEKKRSA